MDDENKTTEQTTTDEPANTTNNADLQDIKEEVTGWKKLLNNFVVFVSNKKNEDKPTEQKPAVPTNTNDSGNANVQELEMKFEKLLKEAQDNFNKQIEELKKAQQDASQQSQDSKIKKAIVKAKEVGYIGTDDKKAEAYLEKILNVDYDMTMQKISEFSKKEQPPKVDPKTDSFREMIKQSAKESLSNFY
jgi:hypothetical protein